MKKVRQIFVGVMLVVLCIGFTSCSEISEDVNPSLIESVDMDANMDVPGEDPEDDGNSTSTGS
jgi:hypothetical protein